MYEQYDVKIIKLKSVLHNNLNIQFLVEITASACCILKSDDARMYREVAAPKPEDGCYGAELLRRFVEGFWRRAL